MNYKQVIGILFLLIMLAPPVSAVYEFPGRYYGFGGTSPFWNVPGTMLISGGFNSSFAPSGDNNDTWYSPIGSSGGVWVNQSFSPWSRRYNARITGLGSTYWVLTGGYGIVAGFNNDTWITTNNGASWTLTNVTNSSFRARSGHALLYNQLGYLVVAGGGGLAGGYGTGGVFYNDSWLSQDWGGSWIKVNNNSQFAARYSMAYTVNRSGAMFILGGINSSTLAMNDVWRTTDGGYVWTQIKPDTGNGGSGFSSRYNAGLVTADDGTMIMMGGMSYTGASTNDTWISNDNGATWTQQGGNAPWQARQSFVYGYDSVYDLIIIAGGCPTTTPFFNDVWTSADEGLTWKPYYSTTYATPGQYSWTAPPGVYNLTMNLAGAGGGGMGAHNGTTYAIGNGGGAGGWLNISKNAVVPYSAYAFSVGLNGTQGAENARLAYQGLPSTALGKSAPGGVAGTQGVEENSGSLGGGSGASTNFLTTNFLAINGSIILGYAGRGYGAGGGGGGHSGTTPCSPGYGGSGAPGVIRIFTEGSWWDNTPEFATTTTTSTTGTTITFIDQSTIRNNVGVYYLWNFGDGTTSTTQASVNHSYAYPGSFTVSLTVGSATGEFTTTKESYIQITGTNSQTWYSPSQVRFTVLDYLGNNVAGARVNATYVESTMPSAVTWLASVYGVNTVIAAEMLSTNTVMSGLTGGDGAVVFTMHSSLQYNVTANNSFGFVSTKVYPKEMDYNIWLPATTYNNTYSQIGYNLTFWEPNNTYYTMGATYQDNSSLSRNLTFYVNATNGTIINYTHIRTDLGTTVYNITKTIPNTRGDAYYWGLRVERNTANGGNISVDRGVTSKGANGVLVDLSLPNGTTYYPWIAFFLLLMITSLASKANVRFMLVIMAVMAAMFWWFGWLQGIYLTTVIPFACFLGAIFYMKGSLRENYGVGGSGSMLVNIVVFLIILQMMIGFINGIGIFNQAAMMTPSNQFTNVDLTTIQNTTSNFGGINDPLQSANAYASIGWATFKILLMMIGAVFVVAPFLIEMFPYVPATFFLILQAGIWVIYVLFIAKAAGKLGSEVDF